MCSQSHSTDDWIETFLGREKESGGIVPYMFSTVTNMQPFLARAVESLVRGASVLEVGCGPCFLSIWLSHRSDKELNCWALEFDRNVLEYASRNITYFRANVKLVHGDMFSLPFTTGAFDTIIHDGVFEHFTDDEIRKFLVEQMRVARRIVFSVPVARARAYPGLYGDERLLSVRYWKKLLESAGANVRGAYGSTPPRGLPGRMMWRGMGSLGLEGSRAPFASAVTFTVTRG